ncbi:MAG: MFS transporter [Actinomycetia bacterium]|nr:MFS transporter [Actinomycetes bacterium]
MIGPGKKKIPRASTVPVPWALVLAGAAIAFLVMGTRQTFGIFLTAVTDELGSGREAYSLAVAILSLLMGIPVGGYLADRFDPRRVLLGSAIIYCIAMLGVSRLASAAGLLFFLGILGGIGFSGVSLALVMGAVGRLVPAERRSSMLGVITAGASLGMFLTVPLAQVGREVIGWRWSFAIIAVSGLLIAALAFMFPGARSKVTQSEDTIDEPFVETLRKARRDRSYLLLTTGFFVCGFHVSFIAIHLPAFLTDSGLSGRVASLALAMIGLFNIIGSPFFGRLGDTYRKRTLLSLLYGLRGVLMIALLLVPLTPLTAILFGATMGLVWLGTVPLTSATVAHLLGARYLTTMFGVVFFSHQVGGFLGVWLGGRIFDATGSYVPIWLIAIGLAAAAVVVHLPIQDQRQPAGMQPATAEPKM